MKQKFPLNRSAPEGYQSADSKQQLLVNGGRQASGAPLLGANGLSPTHRTPSAAVATNGQQHQFSGSANENSQQEQASKANSGKQHLLPNGMAAINSFQLGGKSAKQQCEIHHNILHHPHHHQSRSAPESGAAQGHKRKVNFCRAWLNKFPSRSKRIDVISRIFFPKMFALFNLVYWTTYLFREDDIVRS